MKKKCNCIFYETKKSIDKYLVQECELCKNKKQELINKPKQI